MLVLIVECMGYGYSCGRDILYEYCHGSHDIICIRSTVGYSLETKNSNCTEVDADNQLGNDNLQPCMYARVLSSGGGGGEASPPKFQLPPKNLLQ